MQCTASSQATVAMLIFYQGAGYNYDFHNTVGLLLLCCNFKEENRMIEKRWRKSASLLIKIGKQKSAAGCGGGC
jgi:hypothetical protein